MNCSLFRRHVDAFLDAEVDPTTQIEFERHVAACAGCQEVVGFERATRRSTRSALSGLRAPDALRAQIAARLASAPEAPPLAFGEGAGQRDEGRPLLRVYAMPKRYALPLALAAAAALALVAVGRGAGGGGEPVATEAGALPLFEEVARLHSTPLPSDVADPKDEQVLSYFRGKVEFPVRPAAFPEGHAKLVGARVSNVRERRAAALYYDVHGRRMTVVVYADPRLAVSPQVFPAWPGLLVERVNGRPVAHRRVGGYTVSALNHDGLTYALTGDMDERTLVRLAATAQIR
jgi:anti-sigma factor (TIGR02949 family)